MRITESQLRRIVNETLLESDQRVELIKVSDLERGPRRTIGRQGTTAQRIREILALMFPNGEVNTEAPIPEIFRVLRADPDLQKRALEFAKKDPIEVDYMGDLDPDFPYEIKDGHHRATVLQGAGIKEIPAIVRRA